MKCRIVALAFVLIVVAARCGGADPPKPEAAAKIAPCFAPPPCNCPLFELEYYPPNVLYYCDFYETSCNSFSGVGYHFGPPLSQCPYVTCSTDCAPVDPFKDAKKADVFDGRTDYAPLTYMHNPAVPQQPRAEGGSPALSSGTLVNKKRDNHFIKVRIGDRTIFAKVIEFHFNRPIALGQKEVTDPASQADWEAKLVAFQIEKNPEDEGHEVHLVFDVEQPKPANPYIYRGRTNVESGKSVPVLILLKGQQPAGAKEK